MKAIGLDIGTTTISTIVIDGRTGIVLETITKDSNSFINSREEWEKLQDVNSILENVNKVVSDLVMRHSPISCIGVTGQMHGIVYIDKSGNAVSPLYTWQDSRGDLFYKDGLSYADYLSKETGYSLAAGYGAVTHFYNILNNLVPKDAITFCTIQDYIAMKLSHNPTPLTHNTNAASFGLFDNTKNKFENSDTYFPEVSKKLEIIGFTKNKIPVAIAIGDNQASFLGSVKNKEDSLLINIGTGSQISACTNSLINCTDLEIRPFIEDTALLVGAPLCGGRAYSLLERFFRSIVTKSTGQECASLYDVMGKIALESMQIKNKLNLSTQFNGTRKNPNLRGAIENIDINNFTMEHFIIGIMEGMVSELFDLYKELLPKLKENLKVLIGSGNGLRRNIPLQKIVSKMFDLPISIPCCEEEAAYGAALFALTSIGYYKDISEAQSKIKYIDIERICDTKL